MGKKIILYLLYVYSIVVCTYSLFVIWDQSMEYNTILFSINTCVFITIFLFDKNIFKFTPGFIVVMYMIFTNLSYSLLYLLDYKEYTSLVYTHALFYGKYINKVFALSTITITMIILFWKYYSYKHSHLKVNKIHTLDNDLKKIYSYMAYIILYSFLMYLLLSIFTGSLSIDVYNDFIKFKSENSIFNYLLRLYWISIVYLITIIERKEIKTLVIPVLIISIILLITGNRNEALTPLVIGYGIFVLKNKKVPKISTFLLLFVVFVLNPVISATRKINISEREIELGLYFKEAIIEMGAQVRPFSIMLSKIDSLSDFAFGKTYIYPSIVILVRNQEFRSFYEASEYNISTLMGGSGLAFTSIAEVYFNFSIIGIIIFGALLGKFIAINESIFISEWRIILYGQVMVLAFHLVRNSFKYSLTHIIWIVLFFVIGWLIRNIFAIKT